MANNDNLRIVYVGWLHPGQTSLQRLNALENLGYMVKGIDATPQHQTWIQELPHRISGKLFRLGLDRFGFKDRNGENEAVLRLFRNSQWDILWIDKGITIEAETIHQVRHLQSQCRIIGYSPDDMYARHNQSRPFLQSLPLYDVYFTTKSYGVSELKALGAKEVHFVGNAYDSSTHRPIRIGSNDRKRFGGKVGFIGAYESERFNSINFLISNNIAVRIWGPNWPSKNNSQYFHVEKKCLWGDDYVSAICAFDINLGFLRKINRDHQTTRSIEIPACGAFMLAERTEEHQELFEEGKEAEYFDSNEELLDKVRYYLVNEEKRRKIAAAGRERCLRSGYSNEARLSKMINIVNRFNT